MRSLSDSSFSSSSAWGRQRVASRPSTERRARRRRAVDERRDESCRRADGSASPSAGWGSNQRTHILEDRCQEGWQVAHGPRRVRKRRGEGLFASPVSSRRSTRSRRCVRAPSGFCLRHAGSGRSTTHPFMALRRPCTLAPTLLPTRRCSHRSSARQTAAGSPLCHERLSIALSVVLALPSAACHPAARLAAYQPPPRQSSPTQEGKKGGSRPGSFTYSQSELAQDRCSCLCGRGRGSGLRERCLHRVRHSFCSS